MNKVLETLAGLIERITYRNDENGFCVLKTKVEGFPDLVTLVGYAQTLHVGEHFSATGTWTQDKNFSRQFKAETLLCYPPTSIQGMEKYLGSGLIKGVGPVYATKLMEKFQDTIFTVIENDAKALTKIPGISLKRALQIQASWAEQKQIREIVLFLHHYGVSTSRAIRIYKAYGQQAIDILRTNPYQLAEDIRGIGFLSADQIAASLGINKDSPQRLKAGLNHLLIEAQGDGHCALPYTTLLEKAAQLLEVSVEHLKPILTDQLDNKFLYVENDLVFPSTLYHMERSIADHLKRLQQSPGAFSLDAPKAVTWIKDHLQFPLSASQEEALTTALAHKVAIITGGPGVGKTTLVKCLLTILQKKTSKIFLCAPTGRAAKRMSESTGHKASTIHKLLEFSQATRCFKYDDNFLLPAEVVIVDEVSMLDTPLMQALLRAIPASARLYLIGDVDQLPSVGPGQILKDCITAKTIPTLKLTEIFRQAQESSIILNAHRVNTGQMPLSDGGGSDFVFLKVATPEEGFAKILEIMQQARLKKQEIQLLTPMKAGLLGTHNLNAELQKVLNPRPPAQITLAGQTFAVGDPILQTVNNYDKEVYNGDIGFLSHLNLETKVATLIFDHRPVAYEFSEMDQVDLAYAMTIHKSQGSEFEAVLIPLFTTHYALLMRNLLYTAMTRGKHKVILVGDPRAVQMAVQNNTYSQRWTNLEQWLRSSGS